MCTPSLIDQLLNPRNKRMRDTLGMGDSLSQDYGAPEASRPPTPLKPTTESATPMPKPTTATPMPKPTASEAATPLPKPQTATPLKPGSSTERVENSAPTGTRTAEDVRSPVGSTTTTSAKPPSRDFQPMPKPTTEASESDLFRGIGDVSTAREPAIPRKKPRSKMKRPVTPYRGR